MGVKVEKSINLSVTREALRAKAGKLDSFDSIFNRFDTNNDGALDESEQLGMMAFLSELSGGDGKLTKKDMKDANTSKIGENITYKDMEKFVKAYNSLLKKDSMRQKVTTTESKPDGSEQAQTQYKAGNRTYTLDEHNRVASKKDGDVTTEYTYNDDNNITSESITDASKSNGKDNNTVVTTNNYSYESASGAQNRTKSKIVDNQNGTETDITYTETGRNQTTRNNRTGVVTEEVYAGDDIQTRKVTDNRYNQTQVTTTHFKTYNGSRVADKSQTVTTTDNSVTTTDITYSADGTTKENGSETVIYNSNGTHIAVASLNGIGDGEGYIKESQSNFNFNGDTRIPVKTNIVFTDSTDGNPHTMEQTFFENGTARHTSVVKGKQSTDITYNGTTATETVRDGNTNVETVRTYSAYDSKTGRVAQDKKTKEVELNKNNHVRTTKTFSNGAESGTVKYEQLDTANSQVLMTAEVDSKNNTVKYTSGNQSISMQSSAGKYILVTAKWDDSKKKMETVRQVAIRLGYSGSDLEKILEANGKSNADKPVAAGKTVKIPVELTLNKSFSAMKAASEVDAEKQLQAYNAHQNYLKERADLEAQLDEATRAARCGDNYGKSADAAIKNWSKKSTTRATFASDNYRVFCDSAYTGKVGNTKYQQHYIYSAYENKMVEVESVCKNIPAGQKVTYMSSTGYATLTNGQSLQLDLDDNKIHGKKYVGGYDPSSGKAKEIQERLKALEKRYKDASKIESTTADQYVENVKNNINFELANHAAEEADSSGTPYLQDNTNYSQYQSDSPYAKNLADNVTRSCTGTGLNVQTTSPYIYRYGNTYQTYVSDTPNCPTVDIKRIKSISPDGKTITGTDDKTYDTNAVLLANRIEHIASHNVRDDSTKKMYDAIVNNINGDNVLDVLAAYPLFGERKGILGTFTSESCSSGANGGRERAVNSAKHIVMALLDKASNMPEIKDFNAIKNAKSFLDDKLCYGGQVTPQQYINGNPPNDEALDYTAQKVIDDLVEAIRLKRDTNRKYIYDTIKAQNPPLYYDASKYAESRGWSNL